MTHSRSFWLGTLLLALIPVLVYDFSQKYIDWQKDVREEIIVLVQDIYPHTREEKALALDRVFALNQSLGLSMAAESIGTVLCLIWGIRFLIRHRKMRVAKPAFEITMILILGSAFFTCRILAANFTGMKEGIEILHFDPEKQNFRQFYETHFKGKVLYIDFWGTTCGPCLAEFRDFNKPLKRRFSKRKDIAYLYIGRGDQLLWYRQIRKYNLSGSHIFLADLDYDRLYRRLTADSGLIYMPRYLILNREGRVVENRAASPGEKSRLYPQLDAYLAGKP